MKIKEKLSSVFGKFKRNGKETDRTLKQTLRDIFTVDIVPKLVCVLMAVLLWFYVIETDSPTYEETFSGVSIDFSESLRGFEVLSSDRNTVSVVLSGKRSEITRMRNSDISASVDISHITEAGQYVLDIRVSTSNETSVESYSPRSIYVYLDKSSSRSIPVRADYTGGTSDDKMLKIGELEPSEKMIRVYGPEELLSRVEAAEVTVDIGLVSRSVNITNRSLSLVGSDGEEISNAYMRCEPSSVDVYVPVFMEKDLAVMPTFKYGCFDMENIDFSASPATVKARGDIDVLEKMEAVYTAPVDETQIGKSATLQLDYKLPEGVSLSGVRGKCNMTLSIHGYREKTIAIGAVNIQMSGTDETLFAEALTPVYVNVCGSEAVLNTLSASDFSVVADASGLVSGEHDGVPVAVSFASQDTKNVFLDQTNYTTTVKLTEKTEK